MINVAVVFAKQDGYFALNVMNALRRSGFMVRPEISADSSIGDALDFWERGELNKSHADRVVLIASAYAYANANVLDVAIKALTQNLLVPINVDSAEPPSILADQPFLDMKDWDGDDFESPKIKDLIERINRPNSAPQFTRSEPLFQSAPRSPPAAGTSRSMPPLPKPIGPTGARALGAGFPIRMADKITLSCFSPKLVQPARDFVVQCFLHLPEESAAVRRSAAERDPRTERTGAQSLGLLAASGDTVLVKLAGKWLSIEDPVQAATWRGEFIGFAFSVRAPFTLFRTRSFLLRASVEINGAPAGRLSFVVEVSPKAKPTQAEPISGYEPYRYVFMSYASADRAVVEEKARVLQILGIPYFMDAESLRAGDDWKTELREHVNRSDMFMLFWSPAAAKSKWVQQEAMWALKMQKSSPTAEPEIKPYKISKECPPPPPRLSHLHFEHAG